MGYMLSNTKKWRWLRFLKDFFSELESKLFTFFPDNFTKLRISTVEDSHLTFVLILDVCEDFVPVWSASLGPGLKSSNQIFLLLIRRNDLFWGLKLFSDKT